MLTTLAHLGHHNHPHDAQEPVAHYEPIVISAGVVIIILFLIILYFLMAWRPKTKAKTGAIKKLVPKKLRK